MKKTREAISCFLFPRSILIMILSLCIINISTAGGNEANASDVIQHKFKAYWYSGKAEITRYALEQARYGEIRQGYAVLIFVTEDFLTGKQVKHDMEILKTRPPF